MADRLNLSLDDIIAAKKSSAPSHKFPKNKKHGAVVHSNKKNFSSKNSSNQSTFHLSRKPIVHRPSSSNGSRPISAPAVIVSKKQFESNHGKNTIFDRLGTSAPVGSSPSGAVGGVSGTKITISNLNLNISIHDITELCASVGEVKQVEMKHNRYGNPLGIAEVLFARRSDATTAIKKFHGLTLDGTPMKASLTGENGKVNPFNPLPFQEEPPNKRLGFFGTALQGETEGELEEEDVEVVYVDEDGNPIEGYAEQLQLQQQAQQQRGFAFSSSRRVNSSQPQPRTTFAVTLRDDAMPSGVRGRGAGAGRGRGGGGRGGRGSGRGGRGGGRSSSASAPLSSADLDAEMESYMTKR